MINLNIKIPHYSKLKDRKLLIDDQLKKIKNSKINYIIEFYEKYNKEEINDSIINQFFDLNLREWNRRAKISIQKNTSVKRKITNGEMSLIMKSLHIWKKIVDNNIEYCLIVEDDSCFVDNFTNKYLECINNFPSDWDIIFINLEYISESDNIKPVFKDVKSRRVYNKRKNIKKIDTKLVNLNKELNKHMSNNYFTLITNGQKWKYGYGYIIKKETAAQFYKTLIRKKCVLPIDMEIGYLIEKHKLKSYFYNQNLIYQNLFINSSLSPKRRLARKGLLK